MKQDDERLPGNLPYFGFISVPSPSRLMREWYRMLVVQQLNQFMQAALFALGSELIQQSSQSEVNHRDDDNQQLTEPPYQK